MVIVIVHLQLNLPVISMIVYKYRKKRKDFEEDILL